MFYKCYLFIQNFGKIGVKIVNKKFIDSVNVYVLLGFSSYKCVFCFLFIFCFDLISLLPLKNC